MHSSKRFQTRWSYITAASDDMFDARTAVLRSEIVSFCKTALEESHPRELGVTRPGTRPVVHDFPGWGISGRSFFSSTWSTPSCTLDGQGDILFEAVHVPESIQFNCEGEEWRE